MAIQTINIGNRVNDGLGDDLRTAFEKVNANFSELDTELSLTASNVGINGAGVFRQKVDGNLEFKSIVGGDNINLVDNPESIIINNDAPDAFVQIDTDSGTVRASAFPRLTMGGRASATAITETKDIIVSTNGGSDIRFTTSLPFTEIISYYDFGPLGEVTAPGGNPVPLPGESATPATNFDSDAQYKYTTQLSLATSNIDFGTLTFEGTLVLDCGVIG